jgi:polyisoprenoid-binding protein YceI
MLGRAVLDVARFPTAEFKIASATRLEQKSRRGLDQYELAGDFTLHGVTRQIKIIADAEPKDGWVHLRGAFSILQSQFGIQPFTKAFGAIGVADKLTIYGDLWVAGPGQTAGRSGSPRSPAVN